MTPEQRQLSLFRADPGAPKWQSAAQMDLLKGFRPVSDPYLAQIRNNAFWHLGKRQRQLVLGLISRFLLLMYCFRTDLRIFFAIYCFRTDLRYLFPYILFQSWFQDFFSLCIVSGLISGFFPLYIVSGLILDFFPLYIVSGLISCFFPLLYI